ncbi:hypothetical protein GKC29_25310 [Micromonospora sp. WMMC415]|uniref:hypothetical protein n=1 Tax=Micromonospora sp. WMMC415 TaxID=2675222 RepID=UPI0012B4EE92|nr:hypothetical protein [Micromonospora sp. WMMC415]QGN49815.1 hypothetical protein GKC29_25310 [Micromonospora sp. WMMC415]
MVSAHGSLAQAAYQRLMPTAEGVRSQMEDYAERASTAAREHIFRLVTGQPSGAADALDASLEERKQDIQQALSTLRVPYDDHKRFLQLGITTEDDVIAQLSPFPDGSGLALMSDSLAGLCGLYSSYVALLFSRFNRTSLPLRVYEAIRLARGSWKDDAVVATTLRCFYLHHRTAAEPMMNVLNLHDTARRMVEFFTDYAMFFVFAHESAHHLLGHAPRPSGFTTHERLRTADDQIANEEAADRLGMQITIRHAERRGSMDIAVIGALIAIWSTGHLERATFLRTGSTHPPMERRTHTILSVTPEHLRLRIPRMLATLDWAGKVASDFRNQIQPEWWSHTFSRRKNRLMRPPTAEQLSHLRQLEMVQCQPRAAATLIEQATWTSAEARHVSRLRTASSSGELELALTGLGVRPSRVAELLDRDRPLTYSKLKRSLEKSLMLRADAGTRESDLLSTALASTAAASLARL